MRGGADEIVFWGGKVLVGDAGVIGGEVLTTEVDRDNVLMI